MVFSPFVKFKISLSFSNPVLFVDEKKLFIKLNILFSTVDVTLNKQKKRNMDDTLNDLTCLIFLDIT